MMKDENKLKRTIFVPVGTSLTAKAKVVYSDHEPQLTNIIEDSFRECVLNSSDGSNQNIQAGD